ncbi:transposase [Actinoplanes auranticolor]|uniref:Transposase IS116/IS110/IS902 C-terminal domain-containing protein n=1 Tax=Actinoplanes auranticolor TaxID=47988 RepID=A0A919W2N0_9ACTN|nr:transposase [Actinoplanes auranticolor]GIM77593.1 hypothetical protein Aau02nite_76610 [Actinoplanes auranticolor]
MPGIGVRTAARILLEAGDGSTFATPGHLAAYAGLAPGHPPFRQQHPRRALRPRRQQTLSRAFFLAALADPSRAYYDRERARGNRHNADLICLARRRCDVPFFMLRDKIPYRPRPATA